MRFLVQNGPFSSFARNGSKTVRPMTLMGKWAGSGRAGVQLPPLTSAVALGVSIPQLPQFSTRAQNSYRYRCCTTCSSSPSSALSERAQIDQRPPQCDSVVGGHFSTGGGVVCRGGCKLRKSAGEPEFPDSNRNSRCMPADLQKISPAGRAGPADSKCTVPYA